MTLEEIPKKNKTKFSHWIPFYIMGLPGLAYLIINNYLPMFGLQIAFKKYNYAQGIWGSKWCGFANFEYLFSSEQAFRITRNTILYNLVFIVLGMILGVAVAIFVNEVISAAAKRFYQTVILLPYLMSMVIVAYLVYAYLSPNTGLVNAIIRSLGGGGIEWYSDTVYWPFILVFVNQWKTIGFSMVLYLASLVGISKEYYEAAQIDGASKWQQIKSITLPLLKPTMITLLILNCGRIFRSDFGLFFQVPMNQGALYSVTDTLDTFVYRSLMEQPNMAMSSAAGFYQSVVCFICVLLVNGIVRKVNKENAMF
ncbi:MAG TPA: sugar ABC transporter permease [Candidatus Scybalocola faecigallinarum]|uniref:Sugar ABC transporter permease n=1 Tax=Candidatus Scybalocola faecigallinarum TaxID=2840941 RepID=A0A9D1JSC5_9FIRM|nr:sugar ABC transporter permease [Candidatus Scybalocola faecigallinarum]